MQELVALSGTRRCGRPVLNGHFCVGIPGEADAGSGGDATTAGAYFSRRRIERSPFTIAESSTSQSISFDPLYHPEL